jgi:tRNA nucleotidyltransferase (CCA-adding enzyme)
MPAFDAEQFSFSKTPGEYLRKLLEEQRLPSQLLELVGCEQDSQAHPEGDVFNHTCHVVDAMARICKQEGITGDRRLVLMLAALLHDVGKPLTTEFCHSRQRIISHDHDEKGVPVAEAFLKRLGPVFSQNFSENITKILGIVRYHMYRCNKEFSRRAIRRLAKRLYPATIRDLILMFRADCAGRPPLPAELSREVLDQFIPRATEIGVLDGPGVSPDVNTLSGDSHGGQQQIDEQGSRNQTVSSHCDCRSD